jgi:hypothetical protein
MSEFRIVAIGRHPKPSSIATGHLPLSRTRSPHWPVSGHSMLVLLENTGVDRPTGLIGDNVNAGKKAPARSRCMAHY